MTKLQFTAVLLVAVAALAVAFSPSAATAGEEEQPAVVAPAEQPAACCCPAPCIRYRQHRVCRAVCPCDCRPPVETVLQVTNPRTCCTVEVPVCLPACCEGEPCVTARCGLLGRGIVNYRWCCGFRVKVVFDRCGNLTVHTYGS